MQPNFISILNTPSGTRSVNIDNSNGVVTGYGLSPFKENLIRSCSVTQSVLETPQVWAVAMTAGVANTVSFYLTQVVNGTPTSKTFSFTQTTSTTAADLLTQVNGFFGATATDGGGYVTASWGSVQYKAVISSTTLTVTIKNAAGYPIASVNEVSNINSINSAMDTVVLTTSGANTSGQPIIFKKVGHGLTNGQLLSVPTLTGQTAANGVVGRVTVVDADNFNLSSVQTGAFYLATSTTATSSGTLTFVASAPFGTAALVNADSASNNSTQVATVTANNYSLVTFVAGYDNTTTAEASTRIAPIHYWISEDTNGIAAVNWIVSNLLS